MKQLIIFLGLLLNAILIEAQPNNNTELKKLINQSFTFFPRIKEVENEVIAANEKLTIADLNKNPDINLNTSYNFVMPKISFPINGKEIQFAPVNNFNGTIGSSYTLIDCGRFKASITKAKSEIELAKNNVEFVKKELASQVAQIYYSIIYLQKAMDIQDSVITYFKANKKIAESKVKNGELLPLDIYTLQANIDAEENKKIDLLNALLKQSNLLMYTTGTQTINDTSFEFSNTAFQLKDSVLSYSQLNNPELRLIENKIMIAKNEWSSSKLTNKPSLTVHGATGIKNGYVPNVNEVRFNYMAGVSLLIPIYNFGKQQALVRWKQTLVHQAEFSKESKLASINKDINQAFIDIQTNTDRIKNAESQIYACKKAAEITSVKYQNGVATYLDIIAAATNIQKATLSKVNYEFQLCQATIELTRLMGLEYWKE